MMRMGLGRVNPRVTHRGNESFFRYGPRLPQAMSSSMSSVSHSIAFIGFLYDGSAASVVLQALSSKKASKQDMAKIRELLDELEEDAS